jgi:hypothetical protein
MMPEGLWIPTKHDETHPMRIRPASKFGLIILCVVNLTSSIGIAANDPPLDTQEFTKFWSRFRRVTLEKDWKELQDLTTFPLNVRGELDSAPIHQASRRQFSKIFDRFLRDGVFSANEQLEIIRKTTTRHVAAECNDTCRVGDMIFKKTRKGWRLDTLYMQYPLEGEKGVR